MDAQLDPQAQALLEQMAIAAAVSDRVSPEEKLIAARESHRAVIPLAGEPEPVRNVYERQIPSESGSIPVRIYAPNADQAPVLVYFHGGSFMSGDLDTHDTPLRALANKVGCIIVAVAYRLAPEHPFPAAPEDCYTVTKWVAENADEIGVDKTRIAVGGDSAGGDLAAVVCLMARARWNPAI